MAFHDRLHTAIYSAVGGAVDRISHIPSEWAPDEISKKVVRYLFKAASDSELMQMRWEDTCKELVERAFGSYAAACGDMQWFFEIDLVPAFVQAAMEIVAASGQPVSPAGIQEIVHAEYEDKLDRQMLDKAFWDVTNSMFGDDKAAGKVRHALSKAYWPALDEVLNDGTLHREMMYGLDQATELRRVESFTRKWLEDAMGRSWMALENAGQTLSEDLLMDLVRQLITPFGEESPFSCLPAALTEGLGRPPPDWAFIRSMARDLFAVWNGEVPASSSKKRKKGRAGGAAGVGGGDIGGDVEGEEGGPLAGGQGKRRRKGGVKEEARPDDATFDEDGIDEQADGGAGAAEDGGEGGGCHPECTSADDCIGSPSVPLIRHLHNGKPGDLYCELCWESFCQRNPNLKGVLESDSA